MNTTEAKTSGEGRLAATDPARAGCKCSQPLRHWQWLVAGLLTYFGLRLLFFASTISGYVPPDETTHLGISKIFSRVFLLPANSPDTYQYGLVTNIPWLYYWLMGKLLLLNVFGFSDLLFLRLLNIPFAFATVYFVWRTLRLLTDDRLTQLLLIAAMTNTLMFSFLSASVSYDNLTTLLAAISIYYLLAYLKERAGSLLCLSLLCQLAGCLAKSSFLPLVLILNTLLLVCEFKNLHGLPSALRAYFKATGRRGITLLLAILVGLLLNLQLYGGNYIHYKKLVPDMTDVLSYESAIQNRVTARNMIFSLFKEGRISYEDAIEMTAIINHDRDRTETIMLIQNYEWRRYSREELLSPLEFLPKWVGVMLASSFGVVGHFSMLNQGVTLVPVMALMVLAGLAILVRWRPVNEERLPTCLAAVAGMYAAFILYGFNYRIYLDFEQFGIALQGRYLFPILGTIYVVSCYYLLRLFKGESLRSLTTIAAAIVFIASDFPFFLLHATPDWFGSP